MTTDLYEKEERDFLEELEAGKFYVEVLEDEGPAREEKEDSDVAAFEASLESEDFKSFREEFF